MFGGSFGSISQEVCASTFSSSAALKSAVAACMKLSQKGDCPNSEHGPIGEWNVQPITDMEQLFIMASSFSADISKWDVSSVTTMNSMFAGAGSFNSDLSKWDVSSVVDMRSMFSGAAVFDGDLSKWDVSKVTDMDHMFLQATLFNHQLCRAAWVNSKATKKDMFTGSSGSISRTVCILTTVRQYVSRRPVPDRELIVRAPMTTPAKKRALDTTSSNEMACPKCGTFKKSGRASCCAPGGAWFQQCGGAGKKNVGHTWFEGAKLCKLATKTSITPVCPKCGTTGKSGKASCCGRGGSWFGNCGSAGNAKFDHTWYEGIQVCKTLARSKAAIARQSNAAQQRNFSDGSGMITTRNITMTTTIIEEAAIIPDWISQGIIFTCLVFLMLIAVAATGYLFINKTDATNKKLLVVSHHQPVSNPVVEDSKGVDSCCSLY